MIISYNIDIFNIYIEFWWIKKEKIPRFCSWNFKIYKTIENFTLIAIIYI